SSIPSTMLPTSHVSMWECRLEDDHREAKCIFDYKEEMGDNNQEFLRSGSDYGVEF
nr:alcohol dehydrogenase, C-terminal [Tanacetum cinerariifolium]